jgi:NAD(P)-dependent dehydrogenase (short-subunit alcohol dehydrogenase family)
MDRLAGKVAIVTGGTSGIGRRTVELFVAEGARVLFTGRNRDAGAALAEALGPAALFHPADATDEAETAAAIAVALDRWGRLDCLFNNAGTMPRHTPLEETDATAVAAVVADAVRAVFLGIKHAIAPLRRQGGGSIINNASVAGSRAGLAPPLYSAAKAAVIQLSRCAALELAPDKIRVNSLSPGGVATPLFARALNLPVSPEQASASVARRLAEAPPLRRSGLPDDVAQAALYLASDEAAFVTGQDLIVDGGLAAASPAAGRPGGAMLG